MRFCCEKDREYINIKSNRINNVLEKVALLITTGICVVQSDLVS